MCCAVVLHVFGSMLCQGWICQITPKLEICCATEASEHSSGDRIYVLCLSSYATFFSVLVGH